MITKERAEEIRAFLWRHMQGSERNETPEERQEIKAFWATCPGEWSYYDAVVFMAKGYHLNKEPPKTLTQVGTKKLLRPILITWAQCDPSCTGWLHMNDPLEVERCDDCKRFEDDYQAYLAHAYECGCTWGKE